MFYLKYIKPSYYTFGLFAIKVGLASTAVYYVNQEGIWKSSNESEQTYQKLKTTVSPYVKKATSQIPIELPQLPESNVISSMVKESWNKGVLVSFKFIADLPDIACKWTANGIEAAKRNDDIKKLFNSFSSESVK